MKKNSGMRKAKRKKRKGNGRAKQEKEGRKKEEQNSVEKGGENQATQEKLQYYPRKGDQKDPLPRTATKTKKK
jgi:hypothetical protein